MMSATQTNKAAHKNIVANNSTEWKEVNKNNPCPLCSKPDWCSVSSDASAVLCRRIDTAPQGWKNIKTSKDGYPVFAIDNGDIVKSSLTKKRVTAKPKDKVIPLPTDCSLVELKAIPTDIPKATKSKNQKGEVSITRYIYSDDKSIIREQWVDETKPKGYAKKFKPCRKEIDGYGSPNFVYNKGVEFWGAYRIEEVLREASDTDGTPMILFQEGEGCVEIARSLGIASTCVDGSGWTTEGLTFAIAPIAEVGAGIIYLADNDAPGEKKAKQVEQVCNTLKIPCIVVKSSTICTIPEGGDIKEIMQQLNKEDFIERLQNEIHRAVESRSVVALDDGDGGDDWGDDDDNQENSKPVKELPKHNAMASLLKPLMRNLKYRDDYHQWMRYKDGFWSVASEESIFQMVTDAIEELFPSFGFSSSYPSGVAKMLVSRLLCSEWPEQPRNLLPFKNGVLDLNTKKLLRHSPDYGFESIIDREHDPNATDWSVISDWMDFVFEGNKHQKHLLLCWYAAVLRGMSHLHRFASFIGEGGTGKSTAMTLGTNLIGKQASHSLTLEALNSNSFQTANIYNKRLVCLNDADRYGGNMGIFKNITGGDEFSVERKFQQAFNAVFPGLVMATANNCIFVGTDSGLDRRQIIFRFDRRVPEIDTQFSQKLAAGMSAFTNYLLNIPEDEIVYSLLYKVDESGQHAENELEALIRRSSVAEWMNSNLVYDPDSEIQIGSDNSNEYQLYGNYSQFCRKSGSNAASSKEFSPQIITQGKGLLQKVKSNGRYVIRGVRFSDNGGALESILNLKNNKITVHPPQTPYPPQKAQDDYTASNTDRDGNHFHSPSTLPNLQTTGEGQGGLNTHPPSTLPNLQTVAKQEIQPLNYASREGREGQTEITHKTEQKLRIVIDGQADYLGDVVTIIGFDGKKGTVDVQLSTGRKKTVKRAELKVVNSTTSQQSMTNNQQPVTNNQQQLNL